MDKFKFLKERLLDKSVTFQSTDSTHSFNWQGLQEQNPVNEGVVKMSDLGELYIKSGNDEIFFDENDYSGSALDEYDNEISNSFFFLEEMLIITLK